MSERKSDGRNSRFVDAFDALDAEGDEEADEEEAEDPSELASDVRRKLLQSVGPVLHHLSRTACGEGTFRSDHQRQACIALVRLAPPLLAKMRDADGGYGPGYHPSHSPEQAAALLRRLESRRRAYDLEIARQVLAEREAARASEGNVNAHDTASAGNSAQQACESRHTSEES